MSTCYVPKQRKYQTKNNFRPTSKYLQFNNHLSCSHLYDKEIKFLSIKRSSLEIKLKLKKRFLLSSSQIKGNPCMDTFFINSFLSRVKNLFFLENSQLSQTNHNLNRKDIWTLRETFFKTSLDVPFSYGTNIFFLQCRRTN